MTLKEWIALILSLSAFACAAYFADSDTGAINNYAGAYFAFSLALSLILWGWQHLEDGYITTVRSKRYYRNKHGKMFKLFFFFQIFLPATGMLVIGINFVLSAAQI